MPDSVGPTPRNALLGALADAFEQAHASASRPFGYANPPVEMLSSLLGVPAIAKTLNNLSYGHPLTSGKGMTTRLDPDAVDAALSVAPLLKPAAVGAKATAKFAAPALGDALDNYALKTGMQLPIFIGPKSQAWNAEAAAQAQALFDKGTVSPEYIWRKTGTFKQPHTGILKQEIDDSGAVFRDAWAQGIARSNLDAREADLRAQLLPIKNGQKDLFPGRLTEARNAAKEELAGINQQQERFSPGVSYQGRGLPAQATYEHPTLYDAYPELQSFGIRQMPNLPGGASINPAKQAISVYESGMKDPLSSTTHEMQHAIQDLERWPQGTSPAYEAQRVIEEHMENMLDRGMPYDEAVQIVNDMKITGYPEYLANPGEMEARAAERRLSLTPEQRARRLPTLDYTTEYNYPEQAYVRPPDPAPYIPQGALSTLGDN